MKRAGIVQVVLSVTIDTTDDMELALERYFDDGDGDSGHPHAPHVPCAALNPSLHAHHPSLSPERVPRSLSSKDEAPIVRSKHHELSRVDI